jgi:hypothetical protein
LCKSKGSILKKEERYSYENILKYLQWNLMKCILIFETSSQQWIIDRFLNSNPQYKQSLTQNDFHCWAKLNAFNPFGVIYLFLSDLFFSISFNEVLVKKQNII